MKRGGVFRPRPLVRAQEPFVPTTTIPVGAELRPAVLRHLPLVRHTIDHLGIHRTIDRLLPKDGRMDVSDAECVDLMIINILHGRVALYKMGEWLEGTDVDVVVGEGCPSNAFYDDRLGGTLDRLFRLGTDDVLSEVVRGYLQSDEAPDEYSAHTDTTTIKLYGAYERDLEPGEPKPSWGHSKDHRPDLKQLVYGLSLHGAAGIPLCVSTLDGNASDQAANRFHIDELAGLLPPEDDVTLVADCKLFDPVTVGRVFDAAFHFVTLVPRTYNLREELVDLAVTEGVELPELAREKGRTKKDPARVYRGASYIRPFTIHDPETDEAKEVKLRFLVVESSALAAKFEAGLDNLLAKDRKKCEGAMKKLAKRVFECKYDAAAAFDDTIREPRLHKLTTEIVREVETLSRGRRGRPRKGDKAPSRIVYRVVLHSLEVDEDAVERARTQARFFMLATDHLDSERWPDTRIFAEYRHQHIIEGHTGFRWLKGPAAVAPMFLKTPRRIAALGLVFVLALMVRNYIQWTLRRRLEEEDETLPNMNDQPTQKPTTESAFRLFVHVSVVLVYVYGTVVQRLLHGLTDHAKKVLRLLNVPVHAFTRPRRKPGFAWARSQE